MLYNKNILLLDYLTSPNRIIRLNIRSIDKPLYYNNNKPIPIKKAVLCYLFISFIIDLASALLRAINKVFLD